MKLLERTVFLAFICSILLAGYGVVKYPYAPIKRTSTGFFDKKHNAFTEEQYKSFKTWEQSLVVVGVICGVGAVCNLVAKRLNKKP